MIARDPEIAHAMFDILEAQKLLEGQAEITLVPRGNDLIKQLVAVEPGPEAKS